MLRLIRFRFRLTSRVISSGNAYERIRSQYPKTSRKHGNKVPIVKVSKGRCCKGTKKLLIRISVCLSVLMHAILCSDIYFHFSVSSITWIITLWRLLTFNDRPSLQMSRGRRGIKVKWACRALWQIHKHCPLIYSSCKLLCVVILTFMFFLAFDNFLLFISCCIPLCCQQRFALLKCYASQKLDQSVNKSEIFNIV